MTEFVLGRDGTIWLRREELDANTIDWLVLDADGEPIGTVALPARLTVMAAERGAV